MSFTKREQIVILVVVIVIFTTISYNAFNHKDEVKIIEETIIEENKIEAEDILKEENLEIDLIMVHIDGEVNKPGVYELNKDSRLKDLVDLSGGFKDEAETKFVNLAQRLRDEQKIYIYSKEEVKSLEEEEKLNMNFETSSEDESTGKIDINNASKEKLKELYGIGDSKAQKIIDYRSKTKFKRIEDIKNVSGIGEKTFEKIKDSIVAN